jgi:hypothetical protein
VRTDSDLAYAAGLFDGEGNVSIVSNGRRPRVLGHFYLRATISSTDEELIVFFADRWPGGWKTRQDRGPTRRVQWNWNLKGPRAAAFLADLLPFMRKERGIAKAKLAIEFQAQKSRKMVGGAPGRLEYMQRQREYHVRMKALTGKRLY